MLAVVLDSRVGSLGAAYVSSSWALVSVYDIKGNGIADLQVIEHDTLQLLGVEEKILRLAFARDESIPLIRKLLDSSFHHVLCLEKPDLVSTVNLTEVIIHIMGILAIPIPVLLGQSY